MNETELERLNKTTNMLHQYIEAMNKIEDYFEYRNESQKDKDYVMDVIDRLGDSL
jgi:hypothetical protein